MLIKVMINKVTIFDERNKKIIFNERKIQKYTIVKINKKIAKENEIIFPFLFH